MKRRYCSCVDIRGPNALTKRDYYLISSIEDCNDILGVASVFPTLNYSEGYWHV